MRSAINPDPRRAELGEFLRSRRTQLTTERAGLPATPRRRTPGLRREEVAELARISVALYTWLEQGRSVPVSSKTLDAIASALQLAPGERTHIHLLARGEDAELHEEMSPALRRWVASTRSTAIFVLDHAWNVIMRSTPARAIFGGHAESGARDNLLEAFFLDERIHELFVDWAAVSESLAELLRLDYSRYASSPGMQALVERLRADPGFAKAWAKHGVRAFPSAVRELRHPRAGTLHLEPTTYAVLESPGLRLLMYTSYDDTTRARVTELAHDLRLAQRS
ncbi:MAG: helix-turn-helix transcriptional regulator [Vulcanimicrobiaceae bacterium]